MSIPASQGLGSARGRADPPKVSARRARRHRQALELSVAGLEASLHLHMPAGPYRDFCLWAISGDNPRRDTYLRAVGLIQQVQTTADWLEEYVDESGWQDVLAQSVPLHVFQVLQGMTDALALGLVGAQREDAAHHERRALLSAFSRATLARLRGAGAPAEQLLAPLQHAAAGVSLFHPSAGRDLQLAFARSYLGRHSGVTPESLEHSGWALLVANAEACVDLVRSARGHYGEELVRRGLIRRYEAVERLLERDVLSMPQLALAGAQSTLIIPTLAYYVTLLAEQTQPHERFAHVVQDASLAEAFADVALIVRLLRDLGSELLARSPEELAAVCARLRAEPAAQPDAAGAVLRATAGAGLFTRIRKDLVRGEFNVCLYAPLANAPERDALVSLGDGVRYFSRLYLHTHARLRTTLAEITERLGDERISGVILRYVRCHERLYRGPADPGVGEPGA